MHSSPRGDATEKCRGQEGGLWHLIMAEFTLLDAPDSTSRHVCGEIDTVLVLHHDCGGIARLYMVGEVSGSPPVEVKLWELWQCLATATQRT